MTKKAPKLIISGKNHFRARDGRFCIIEEHPHETENGDFPDGFKIEFDDGETYTVDGASTVLAYIEHLGLTKV